MTVAIIAKYIAPTNTKGARIKVQRADHGKNDVALTVDFHSVSGDYMEAFRLWTEAYKAKKPEASLVQGTWTAGHTGTGAVFVRNSPYSSTVITE